MRTVIRTMTILASVAITACGGGGGGSGGGSGTPVVSQNVQAKQGVYWGSATDAQNQTYFAQALVTAGGRALVYISDGNSLSTVTVLVDGTLVDANGTSVMLSGATAYALGQAPAAATGTLTITNGNPGEDAQVTVTFGGSTFTVSLQSFPADYNTGSSLQRSAGMFVGDLPTLSATVDSAGQLSAFDSSTNCALSGRLTVDTPSVNSYALTATISMCADATNNGTYTGRASVVDDTDNTKFISFFAHSATRPFVDPFLATMAP